MVVIFTAALPGHTGVTPFLQMRGLWPGCLQLSPVYPDRGSIPSTEDNQWISHSLAIKGITD